MSDMPWAKFYPSDWFGGTAQLSAAEKGIYITLIMAMYDTGKTVAEDYTRLGRMCGAGAKATKTAIAALIELEKIIRVEGGLWNKRVGKEIGGAAGDKGGDSSVSEKRRAAAQARWSKAADEQTDNNDADFAYANGDAKADFAHAKPMQVHMQNDANVMQTSRAGALPETRNQNKKNKQKNDFAYANGDAKADANPETPPASEQLLAAVALKQSGGKAAETRQIAAEFAEVFWPKYPHKIGKAAAEKAFVKARKQADLSAIMAGLERYKQSKNPDYAWCNPETFLNQQRWEDEPAPPSGAAAAQGSAPYPTLLGQLAYSIMLGNKTEFDAKSSLRQFYPQEPPDKIAADLETAISAERQKRKKLMQSRTAMN